MNVIKKFDYEIVLQVGFRKVKNLFHDLSQDLVEITLDVLLLLDDGASINKQGEGGVPQMSTILHKLIHVVNLSTKGEGVKILST